MLGLVACGDAAEQSSSSLESSTTSPTLEFRAVPDVIGKSYADASAILHKQGFYPALFGPDGTKWTSSTPDESILTVAMKPAAGTMTDSADVELTFNVTEAEGAAVKKAAAAAATVAAEAKKLAVRYEFKCGGTGWSNSAASDVYHSYKEVWVSPHYAGSDTCSISIDGVRIYDKPTLIPSEQAIADIVKAHGGGGGGSASSDFGRVLQLCTKLERDYADNVVARMDWKKAEAHGAMALCPDAPHAALLQDVITSVKIGDGTYIVGKNLEPGTYRTKPEVKDCYWSRNTGGGSIIANDFISFAPDGATVTVYPGEGFESSRCGVWTKIA